MLDNDLNTICQHNFSDKIKITFSSIYCFRVNGVENRNKKTISNLKIMPKEFKTIKIIKEQLPKVEQKNVKFNQTPAEPIGNKNKIKSKQKHIYSHPIHNVNFNIIPRYTHINFGSEFNLSN